MPAHERSLETVASPDAIWRVWSDVTTWQRWNPDVQSIALNGPFQSGTTGTMTTRAGTHQIRLENVTDGRSFDLVTSPIPATTFRFHCEVTPSEHGSQVSQGITMSGLMSPLLSPLMGNRIAESFRPILEGLAHEAEGAGSS